MGDWIPTVSDVSTCSFCCVFFGQPGRRVGSDAGGTDAWLLLRWHYKASQLHTLSIRPRDAAQLYANNEYESLLLVGWCLFVDDFIGLMRRGGYAVMEVYIFLHPWRSSSAALMHYSGRASS